MMEGVYQEGGRVLSCKGDRKKGGCRVAGIAAGAEGFCRVTTRAKINAMP